MLGRRHGCGPTEDDAERHGHTLVHRDGVGKHCALIGVRVEREPNLACAPLHGKARLRGLHHAFVPAGGPPHHCDHVAAACSRDTRGLHHGAVRAGAQDAAHGYQPYASSMTRLICGRTSKK